MKNQRGRRLSPEKQQELESLRQIESCFDGWLFHRTEDIGEDRFVQILDQGVSTGLTFCLRAKSTNGKPRTPARVDARPTTCRFKVKDLEHWEVSAMPVVLMVWNLRHRRGWWVEVQDAIGVLDNLKSEWRSQNTVTAHFPTPNTTSEEGRALLRSVVAHRQLPALARGRQVVFKPTFQFPSTNGGRQAKNALIQAIEEGLPVTVGGEHIKDFRASDWWERAVGRQGLKSFSIASNPGAKVIPVRLVSTREDVTYSIAVSLRPVRGGTRFVHLSGGGASHLFVLRRECH